MPSPTHLCFHEPQARLQGQAGLISPHPSVVPRAHLGAPARLSGDGVCRGRVPPRVWVALASGKENVSISTSCPSTVWLEVIQISAKTCKMYLKSLLLSWPLGHLTESSPHVLEALTSLHTDLTLTLGPKRTCEASGQGSSKSATAGTSHWE